MDHEHHNNLPSKKFLVRGGIATLVLILILIVQTAWFRALFHKKPLPPVTKGGTMTVGGLVTKDTNGNGIADWEEKLWGLDPTVLYTNGVANKQLIEDKKKALGIADSDTGIENETDLLAKQLFTISTAVGQSDETSSDALKAIGQQLGNDVDLKQITNHYTIANVTTVKTSTASLNAYYNAMSKITNNYKAGSADIDVVISALETGDTSRLPELKDTGASYMALARLLQKVPTPVAIAEQHLALMNGFYGMGQSFSYLLQMDDNGIYGIVGISVYKEYALRADQALSELSDYFVEYGILKQ